MNTVFCPDLRAGTILCVVADDDNMQLVAIEASNVKKDELLLLDKIAGSPAGLGSHYAPASGTVSVVDDAGAAAEQHSVPGCSCVRNTSSLSPTHPTHCLLNNALHTVVSSSVQAQMLNKHSASEDSDRRRGCFMNFIL